jgi:TolA-binding protein
MSQKKTALASTIDQKVVDYVDEVERVQQRDQNVRDEQRTSEVTALQSQIEDMRLRISELEGVTNTTALDDKYTLTKAKLVRLMKDMGYYD